MENNIRRKNVSIEKWLICTIVIAIVVLVTYIFVLSHQWTTTGYYSIATIRENNKRMTVSIINHDRDVIELYCHRKTDLSSLEISEEIQYHISFHYNSLFPKKGKLLFIDSSEYIKNKCKIKSLILLVICS